jgi:2-polyprenyl-6-methoxyphenol hydroxylase-like FAD-dependent oxidoreductase
VRQRSSEPQVLVVGAGPAGLVAAICLARYGIGVLVVEKRTSVSTLSRALVISTRCMEIFRSWGLEAQIQAGAADVESRAWVTPTLVSGDGAEMPLGYPTVAEAAKVSPTRPAWAPQDHLEPLLVTLARSLPNVELRSGWELFSLRQGNDEVRAVLRSTERGETGEVAALFVIGADGAHSTVRGAAGITMDGRDDLAEYHRVEFGAALGEVVGDRRYGLYVITNPDVAGVLTPRGNTERWGLSQEWSPGHPRMADYGERRLVELIAAAVGAATPVPEIERVSSFSFAAQIAQRYREGRVFLVGDAAHRMTPRGGTGMNTAIQDAYDIAWKMGWVLRGWSGDGLLATYESDRRPVGLHNVERAGQAGGAERDVHDALPWDINGRLAHAWLERDGKMRSTLDLLGEGFTLLAGYEQPRWPEPEIIGWRAPLTVHNLDPATATVLGVEPGGALLVRPDGRQVAAWRSLTPRLRVVLT